MYRDLIFIEGVGEVLFSCGQVYISEGVKKRMHEDENFIQTVHISLSRHLRGYFGGISKEDRKLNQESIERGEGIILSAFMGIWIMTTDQEYTTIFLAEEY